MPVDKEVIERINKGDTKAFEQMYFQFYVYLCSVAVKYVYKSDIAREIVNDVFLNVWNNRATLIFPVNAYLIRAIRNRCLNYYRQNRLQEIPLSELSDSMYDFNEQHIMADTNPLTCLENKDIADRINEAIDSLPEKCREIFIQYIYYNKTSEEIACMQNVSPSTVRVQIKIGMSKLRLQLGDLYPLFCLLIDFS